MLHFFASKDGKAPDAIYHPSITHRPDYTAFKQTQKDKDAALTARKNHKEVLKKAYGANWKKHLNTPDKTLSGPIHFTT